MQDYMYVLCCDGRAADDAIPQTITMGGKCYSTIAKANCLFVILFVCCSVERPDAVLILYIV